MESIRSKTPDVYTSPSSWCLDSQKESKSVPSLNSSPVKPSLAGSCLRATAIPFQNSCSGAELQFIWISNECRRCSRSWAQEITQLLEICFPIWATFLPHYWRHSWNTHLAWYVSSRSSLTVLFASSSVVSLDFWWMSLSLAWLFDEFTPSRTSPR